MLNKIQNKDIFKAIEEYNPWWQKGGKVDDFYSTNPKREYFKPLIKQLNEEPRRSIVLMGIRRVGKTVLIYQIIDYLIKKKKVNPQNILFIDVQNPVFFDIRLQKLVELFIDNFGHKKNSKLYIFFDEIQYLNKWEVHLKTLHDLFLHYRFLVSGSACAVLNRSSRESGAGRFRDFLLPSLTLSEFLNFKKIKIEDFKNENFIEYMNYGGFPEPILSKNGNIKEIFSKIKDDIIDKVLLRDLPSIYGIQNTMELNKFFKMVVYNTGNEFSISTLSKESGIAMNTIRKYIDYLEGAFLIKKISRLDQNAKRFKRETRFKIYLTNTSLRTALFGEINEDDYDFGRIVENVLFSQLMTNKEIENIFYANWSKGKEKKEIDLVYLDSSTQKPIRVIEIKWSDNIVNKTNKFKNLIEFCKKHEIMEVIQVTTKTIYKNKEINGLKILFVPLKDVSFAISVCFSAIYCMNGINPLNTNRKNCEKT